MDKILKLSDLELSLLSTLEDNELEILARGEDAEHLVNEIEEIADNRGLKVSFDNLCFDLYERSLYFIEIEILPKFWDLIKVKRSKVEALEVSYSCSSYYKRSLIDTNDDKVTEKANEALRSFNRECLEWLQKDYDYLTSDEAIIETFEANEYLFTLEGEID